MKSKNNTKYSVFLFVISMVLFSCKGEKETSSGDESFATVYYGGDIITMEGDTPEYAEAVVERNGRIEYAGSSAEAMKKAGAGHKMINLEGKTMLPGFIDGHAHFGGFGFQAVAANLLASPDGVVNDIPTLIETLKTWHAENGTDKTQGWILGLGFDDAILAENRFPTKADLDQVSTEIPICIIHISGHFCVMNTKGLEMSNITAESPNPTGGVIRRMPGSQEPNGVLEELAAIPVFFNLMTPKTEELTDYYLDKGQEMAIHFGYTTAQEGRAMGPNHEQFASYADRGKFKIDVVSYIDYATPEALNSSWNSRKYKNRYRIGGLKMTLDGSPQGRTAWRTEPYLIPPDGQGADYSGYPAIPEDSMVQKIVDLAFENNWQLLTHANGDAAVDQLIRTLRPAIDRFGNQDRRNVLIHGQYARFDQIDTLVAMDVIPSLFPMHTFYWGDWHSQIIGPEKAENISPIQYAIQKGALPTSHTDAPVAFPNLMMILWTTVNRVTRSGKVLGAEQRLTPYQALKTITIWSARQHFEEDSKGSIKEGKLADLVILDQNPLKVDPDAIKDIEVLQTIKEGVTVYKK
jgi:predicted amidohydrolase YtcJ